MPFRRSAIRAPALAMLIACAMATMVTVEEARRRDARATARLASAAVWLDSLTDARPGPADDARRAAIAWGYAERLRLGLESPFRLIEAAARDPRLTQGERRSVSWALLSRVLRAETHELDPAVLDEMGPRREGRSISGDRHLELIEHAVATADDPRAAELALRLAYSLAAAERIVEPSAPMIVAEAAALVADREIARREAVGVIRAADGTDPIAVVTRRRARRAFYVEHPALLAPSAALEADAIELTRGLLEQVRELREQEPAADSPRSMDDGVARLAPRLFAAGAQAVPAAPLAVTVRRYLPLIRSQARRLDDDALSRTRNAEMLAAVTQLPNAGRQERRAVGRLLLAAAVSMRSLAQDRVWHPGDPAPRPEQLSALGVGGIVFDRDVPTAWRSYYLGAIADGVADLRRVFPALKLDGVQVRFRWSAPADSALALHDPRTRTLHLPVMTAGGTLVHEIAHDLDRQSALTTGLMGYRSDIAARTGAGTGKVAASLRALTEEIADAPRAVPARSERPAEIFATRVDWLVAGTLALEGISSGFLSAVQDELLTGHVVHPHRLRNSGSARSLLSALEGMTTLAPLAYRQSDVTLHALLRWTLTTPIDRQASVAAARGPVSAWEAPALLGGACEDATGGRAALMRMAAESRARGWMRLRAGWNREPRASWAHAALGHRPWSPDVVEARVAALRDFVLVELAGGAHELPTGFAAHVASVAAEARCGG